MTQAEIAGMKMLAQSMSVKDLKWQIDNAGKCGLPRDAVAIFKGALVTKSK